MGIENNSQIYNITSENQIATILSHFSSNYIIDTIKDKLNNKFNIYAIENPNIVYSFELNFNQMKALHPADINNINSVRIESYREIIDVLCEYYNLQFNETVEDQDIYSSAFYLYDFLVANFFNYITIFFANYIVKEKNHLYDIINTNIDIKEISYIKKIYKDNKIAVISAHLDYIIDYLKGLDISLYDILGYIYSNEILNLMNIIIAPIGDFFKDHYVSLLNNPSMFPIIMTNIRLYLQKIQGVDFTPPVQ